MRISDFMDLELNRMEIDPRTKTDGGAFFVDLVQLGADLNFRTYNHNV